MLKQYKLRNYKFILVILVITLNIIGGLLVASARPSYQNKQVLGMVAGILLMVFVSLIDYRFILKFSWQSLRETNESLDLPMNFS